MSGRDFRIDRREGFHATPVTWRGWKILWIWVGVQTLLAIAGAVLIILPDPTSLLRILAFAAFLGVVLVASIWKLIRVIVANGYNDPSA